MQPSESLGSLREIGYHYVSEFDTYGCTAIVNLFPAKNSDKLTNKVFSKYFILDIDVVKTDLPDKVKDKDMKEFFSQMRDVKNTIFFNTLSDTVLEEYKWVF